MSAAPKGKMLALEITPRLIRAVEFVPNTFPVQVTRTASMERPAGEPSAVGRAMREFLSGNGFAAKRALVGYSGPVIEHRIYTIPPVAGEARIELLRGKVAQETTTPIAEMKVTGEAIGKLSEGGIERQEVLAVYTPEFEIKRLTFLLLEAGISPARIASIPLALASLHPEEKKDLLAGFLHSEAGRCVIGISDGGKLRFSREFALEAPLRPVAAPEPPDYKNIDLGQDRQEPAPPAAQSDAEAMAERLVTELTRSLLYFRQISRGGSISNLYWSGRAPSDEAASLIRARLKLEISPHPAIAASCGVVRDENAAEFGVPIGLAVAGQVPGQANLLPEGLMRRKERRGSLIAFAAVLAVFVAANAGLFAGLQKARNEYRLALSGSASGVRTGDGMKEEFGAWLSLRKAAEDATAGERALSAPFNGWKALFASLGASVPAEVAFASLTIERSGDAFRGELRGKARGKDPSDAQEKVNAFLVAVGKTRTIAEARYAPQEMRPLRAEEGRGYEQEFLVSFSLPREGTGGGR
ncbi:MAG: hypothetical protein HY896_07110 [Deltaproteobacteria bacterium]|nr:hypothetical protein [Deltaproteobacteria bacterium]